MGDIRVTEGQDPPLTQKEKKTKRRKLSMLLGIGVLVIAAIGALVKMDRFVRAQGYVTSEDYAEVRAPVAGRVAKKLVGSGDSVAEGDLLVQLDATAELASLAEAKSVLERSSAALSRRQSEIAEIKRRHASEIEQAKANLDHTTGSIARLQTALRMKVDEALPAKASSEQTRLQMARQAARQASAELVRREAEIAQTRQQLTWSTQEAKLILGNATSARNRAAQMVESQLAPGTALEEARLKEEVASLKLKELQQRDVSLFDKELAVMRETVKASQYAALQIEAGMRDQVREAMLQQNLQQLHLKSLTESDLTVYDKELAEMQQALLGAKEAVSRAEARVRDREIRAPIAGQIVRYDFSVGEMVQPSYVLMEIYGGTDQVLKLKVSERYATKIGPGQPYEAELASYSGLNAVEFQGQVDVLRSIIQQDAGQTYRVAYCSFDPQGLTVPPGTSAEAKIYYSRSCFWFYLLGLD